MRTTTCAVTIIAALTAISTVQASPIRHQDAGIAIPSSIGIDNGIAAIDAIGAKTSIDYGIAAIDAIGGAKINAIGAKTSIAIGIDAIGRRPSSIAGISRISAIAGIDAASGSTGCILTA